MKGRNLYTAMKTTSLIRVKLFQTQLIVLNTMIFLMQLDLEKRRSSAQKNNNCWSFKYQFNKEQI